VAILCTGSLYLRKWGIAHALGAEEDEAIAGEGN
jgi:hypothetical protein